MKTLYKKTRLGKIQIWETWVETKGSSGFPEVHTIYGLIDGKKQTTFDIIKEGVNLGKANATNSEKQAQLEMERRITKQLEDGYKETRNET